MMAVVTMRLVMPMAVPFMAAPFSALFLYLQPCSRLMVPPEVHSLMPFLILI